MAKPLLAAPRGIDAEELRLAVQDFARQMGVWAGAEELPARYLVTPDGVAVPHGKGADLVSYAVTRPDAGAFVWESAPPDGQFIYLVSSSDVTVSVVVL